MSRAGLKVAIGSAFIAFSPFFVEFSKVGAIANSFYRLLFGGIFLLAIAIFKKEKMPGIGAWALGAVAATVMSLEMVVWNQSILYIGPGLATVLANLEIIFLILIDILFFKEKLPTWFASVSFGCIIGVSLIVYPMLTGDYFLGGLLGLSASLIFSIYAILLKVIQSREGSVLSTLPIICLFGSIILGVAIAKTGATFHIPDVQSFFCLAGNGICCQAIGWFFITHGMKQISLSLAGLVMMIQPALTFLIDCLVLGRNTDVLQITGCVILICMIYYSTTKEINKVKA